MTENTLYKKPRILAVANQKGGVGKTTTAVNLATALAAVKKKVLLVDVDPQGNATTSLGIERKTAPKNIYQVITGEEKLSAAIIWSKIPNLSVIASGKALAGLDFELSTTKRPQFYLKQALQRESVPYDYIIIDCPPTIGTLTINALVAADAVLIPVQCEYLALEGVADLIKTVERVRQNFNPNLGIQGIVLTMFDSRNKLSDMVAQDVRAFFKDIVYRTVIPRNVRVSEAPSHGKPILIYDFKSAGAQAYISLAKEVLKREKGIRNERK